MTTSPVASIGKENLTITQLELDFIQSLHFLKCDFNLLPSNVTIVALTLCNLSEESFFDVVSHIIYLDDRRLDGLLGLLSKRQLDNPISFLLYVLKSAHVLEDRPFCDTECLLNQPIVKVFEIINRFFEFYFKLQGSDAPLDLKPSFSQLFHDIKTNPYDGLAPNPQGDALSEVLEVTTIHATRVDAEFSNEYPVGKMIELMCPPKQTPSFIDSLLEQKPDFDLLTPETVTPIVDEIFGLKEENIHMILAYLTYLKAVGLEKLPILDENVPDLIQILHYHIQGRGLDNPFAFLIAAFQLEVSLSQDECLLVIKALFDCYQTLSEGRPALTEKQIEELLETLEFVAEEVEVGKVDLLNIAGLTV